MLSIRLTTVLFLCIGFFVLGAIIDYLTGNFTSLDNLFEEAFEHTTDDEALMYLDHLYNQIILVEGYYRHGRISIDEYESQLNTLRKKLEEYEQQTNNKH